VQRTEAVDCDSVNAQTVELQLFDQLHVGGHFSRESIEVAKIGMD
jgi:hypothetical protein